MDPSGYAQYMGYGAAGQQQYMMPAADMAGNMQPATSEAGAAPMYYQPIPLPGMGQMFYPQMGLANGLECYMPGMPGMLPAPYPVAQPQMLLQQPGTTEAGQPVLVQPSQVTAPVQPPHYAAATAAVAPHAQPPNGLTAGAPMPQIAAMPGVAAI